MVSHESTLQLGYSRLGHVSHQYEVHRPTRWKSCNECGPKKWPKVIPLVELVPADKWWIDLAKDKNICSRFLINTILCSASQVSCQHDTGCWMPYGSTTTGSVMLTQDLGSSAHTGISEKWLAMLRVQSEGATGTPCCNRSTSAALGAQQQTSRMLLLQSTTHKHTHTHTPV